MEDFVKWFDSPAKFTRGSFYSLHAIVIFDILIHLGGN